MNERTQSLFLAWQKEFVNCQKELVELDSVGGDGDLGIVLADGFSALAKEFSESEQTDLGKLLYAAGKLLNKTASSSMGTLLSCGFIEAGKRLKGKTAWDREALSVLVEGMAAGVEHMGKAKEGEKTFLDAIYPAARAMRDHIEESAPQMLAAASAAAMEGVQRAKQMQAVHGRLAFRGANSIGIVDPGTMAAYHFIKAMERAVCTWR